MRALPRVHFAPALSIGSIAVLSWILADRPILDTDYFWHLRTGALIAQTGAIPRVDPYSYSAAGARWVDLHWLFELMLHRLWLFGGNGATRAAGVVLGLLVVGVSAATLWRSDRPALCGVALALLVTIACVRFLLRPDTVSLVLAALVLVLLWRDERKNDPWVFAVVLIQLAWANLHGFQMVGLALVAIALGTELATPWVSEGRKYRGDRTRRLALVLALGVAVSFANPNGVDGVLLPLRQFGMIGPLGIGRNVFGRAIDELRPPFATLDPHSAPALLAFAALTALSGAALVLDRRGFSLFDTLTWFVFFCLAASAVRNIALFSIAAAPIFVFHFGRWLDDTSRIPRALQRAFGGRCSRGSCLRPALSAGSTRPGPTVRAVATTPRWRISGSRNARSTGSIAKAHPDRSITGWGMVDS